MKSTGKPQTNRVARARRSLRLRLFVGGRRQQPKLTTLARCIDFLAIPQDRGGPGFPNIFLSPPDTIAIASYAKWEYDRGIATGAVSAAVSAVADLSFARAHFGFPFPDMKHASIRAWAIPAIPPGTTKKKTRHAGSIPLRLAAGREALANANSGHGPSSCHLRRGWSLRVHPDWGGDG